MKTTQPTIHPKIIEVLKGIYPDVNGSPGPKSYWDMDLTNKQKLKIARKWFRAELKTAMKEAKHSDEMLALC